MKTLNVAIIGAAGWIGSVHAECYTRLNVLVPDAKVVLHTAVDVVEENAKKIAQQLNFLKYTTDYHDVINDPEVDIVDICCNNNFHKEIAIQAANAGKHVFCEKPLAVTLEECRATEKEVMQYPNLVFMLGFMPVQRGSRMKTGETGRAYLFRCVRSRIEVRQCA